MIIEEMQLKAVDSMRFLGTEIEVTDSGLAVSQRKYIAQELRLRGWLQMKGTESLPVPPERACFLWRSWAMDGKRPRTWLRRSVGS